MPDISLFQPQVLRGVVEQLTTPQTLTLLNKIPQTPWPYPTMSWDVITAARNLAQPNIPNSEANVVQRQVRSTRSASFIYLREKKVFEPTTLHWVRTPGDLAKTNAEKAVLREIGDLNARFDLFAEYAMWQALTGELAITTPEGYNTTINYDFHADHTPNAGTGWSTATPEAIVADLRAWKQLVVRNGGVPATEAFGNEATISKIFDAFATTGASNFMGGTLLSDRMKEEYYKTGTLPGFMGLNWTVVEQSYVPYGGGSQETFVGDDTIILGNLSDGAPVELAIGPSADDEAPSGYTGKFAKTWKEKDPSQRQYLLEWSLLPIITRPDQLVVADVS